MDRHVYGGKLKFHCAHSTPRRRQNAHPQPHLPLPLQQPTLTHKQAHTWTDTHIRTRTHTRTHTLLSRPHSVSNHPHHHPNSSRGSLINQSPSGLWIRTLLLLLRRLGLVHVLVDEMEGDPALHELHKGEASCRGQSTDARGEGEGEM